MYEQALVGVTRTLGSDHHFASGIVNNCGLLHAEQGEQDAAQQVYQQARDGFQRSLGSEHPHTKMVCYNIEQLSLTETQADADGASATSSFEARVGSDKPRRRWYY